MLFRPFLLLILFPHLLFSQAIDQEIATKETRDRLKKSNTRFILGWAYDFENDVQLKQGKKCSFEKFDKEGNLIEQIFYNVAGGVNYECTLDYDKKGQEVSRIFISSREYVTRRWIYKQGENGELERWPARSFASQEHVSFRFDPKGRKVQESRYDKDGLQSTIFLKYDEAGNVVEKLELDGNNNLYKKVVYLFDLVGFCVSAIEYDADNQVFRKYYYEYDDAGNKISELVTDGKDRKLQKIKYIYQPFTW